MGFTHLSGPATGNYEERRFRGKGFLMDVLTSAPVPTGGTGAASPVYYTAFRFDSMAVVSGFEIPIVADFAGSGTCRLKAQWYASNAQNGPGDFLDANLAGQFTVLGAGSPGAENVLDSSVTNGGRILRCQFALPVAVRPQLTFLGLCWEDGGYTAGSIRVARLLHGACDYYAGTTTFSTFSFAANPGGLTPIAAGGVLGGTSAAALCLRSS